MPVESTLPSVVVGAAASGLRRALGPTSWMVLEELLLLCSTGPADACVVRVSVRALAGSLGLAKDTVGRAIRRLRDTGLVTVAQQRTGSGIFDTGTYLIAVPDCITVNAPTQSTAHPDADDDHQHAPASSTRTPRRNVVGGRVDVEPGRCDPCPVRLAAAVAGHAGVAVGADSGASMRRSDRLVCGARPARSSCTAASVGWSVVVVGTGRTAFHHGGGVGRGGVRVVMGDRRSNRRPATIGHHRTGRVGCVAGRCRRRSRRL